MAKRAQLLLQPGSTELDGAGSLAEGSAAEAIEGSESPQPTDEEEGDSSLTSRPVITTGGFSFKTTFERPTGYVCLDPACRTHDVKFKAIRKFFNCRAIYHKIPVKIPDAPKSKPKNGLQRHIVPSVDMYTYKLEEDLFAHPWPSERKLDRRVELEVKKKARKTRTGGAET